MNSTPDTTTERLDELLSMAREEGQAGLRLARAEAAHQSAPSGYLKDRARRDAYQARKDYERAKSATARARARFLADLDTNA